MPLHYVIDHARGLVTVTMSETVTGAQVGTAIEAIYGDPAWRPGYDVLWDGTGITQLLFEKSDLPTFVALQRDYAELAGHGRDVILVIRALDFVMAKTYALMMRSAPRPVYVFKSLTEAREILERPRNP
jgi:hypothetical protein